MSFLNLVIPTQSLASNTGIFINVSTAKKILLDTKYCKITEQKLTVCNDTTKSQSELLQLRSDYITGLEKDKIDLKVVSEDYKTRYINTNDELQKAKIEQPSRTTWFTVGVISTLVVSLVVMFLVKK